MYNLKSFKIGEAYYFLENKKGSKLRINVNYAEDKFDLLVLNDKGDVEQLKLQAAITAKHMLGHKAKKNLVNKLLELKI